MVQIKAGDQAPDFKTVDDQGKAVGLADFRGQKVILYFYPKDNTSGCTTQACRFRDSHGEIRAKNAVVLGVSPDGVKSHQKFKSKNELPFPLLVDQDHQISEAYGVWQEKSMYGKKYMGVLRSHFVIDEQGMVVDVQYKVKPVESPSLSMRALSD